MRSNELRVGNYLDFDGKLSLVKEIDEQGVVVFIKETDETEWIDLFQFTPIPLTEEILLKCGFEYNREKTYLENKCCGLKLMDIVGLYYRANFPIKSDIKHLHQLQNIYFALTSEELNIQL